MSFFRQTAAVTWMNLRNIPMRVTSSSVVVFGMAGVVGVLISVLGIGTSLSDTLLATGRADRAVVLRDGTNVEITSRLTTEAALTIMDAPGIARTADGEVAATVDMLTGSNFPKRDGSVAGLTLRGMSAQALAVRPEIELIEGRMYEPGLREFIVGASTRGEFAALDMGDEIELRNSSWRIVGVYTSGDALESALLTDFDTLLSAYQRTDGSSITVLLESEDAFQTFSDALTTNPTLEVSVVRETDYYRRQSQGIGNILRLVTYFVGGIMGVGALLAALNTMYQAVSSRTVEIATLRAIGFGNGAVVVSILVESMLLSLAGALIGAAVAWLLFNGDTINMGNQLTSLVFELDVSATLVRTGVVLACAVGFVGGLFPALHASRLPVARGLRET